MWWSATSRNSVGLSLLPPPGERLEHHHPTGVEIGARIAAMPGELFRRQIAQRARHPPFLPAPIARGVGNAEIHDPQLSRRVENQVLGLDVAVLALDVVGTGVLEQ